MVKLFIYDLLDLLFDALFFGWHPKKSEKTKSAEDFLWDLVVFSAILFGTGFIISLFVSDDVASGVLIGIFGLPFIIALPLFLLVSLIKIGAKQIQKTSTKHTNVIRPMIF